MTTNIAKATASLSTFKGHVQQTIDHINSGVTTLNEDQLFTAQSMLAGLESEWSKIKADVIAALQPVETAAAPVVAEVVSTADEIKSEVESVVKHPIIAVETAATDVATEAKAVAEDVVAPETRPARSRPATTRR